MATTTVKQITSAANADIKRLVTYRDKAKARRKDGLFLIEGTRLFLDTPEQYIREIYTASSFVPDAGIQEKIRRLTDTGVPAATVSDDVFRHVCDTVTPQGILCTASLPEAGIQDMLEEMPLILILDGIQDPGNLGTIFRSAAAAGATGIIMSRDTADITGPKAVRSTMSAIFRTPFYYTEDLTGEISLLKERGIRVFAAAADKEHIYSRMPWNTPCAVIIGNEGNGISDKVMAAADCPVSIPMRKDVESLNAAVAASILLFEAARWREEL
ncbi:MAG: RNA methyltransferase [Lachnospiraceae bacterium]|nr:RNA methyltransferase [Lachnospiraceae bacterium]